MICPEYFSANETKQNFDKLMKVHILEMKERNKTVWSRETVADFIKYITVREANKDNRYPEYSVVLESEGRCKLLINGLEVVPWEDCFDIILKVHREQGHRNEWHETFLEVSKQYVIDEAWIRCLLEACNVCKHYSWRNLGLRKHLYATCEIFIMAYDMTPDPPYKFILVVVDKATRFVQLRPTVSVEHKSIAVELVKIFANFGLPQKIETKEEGYFIDICRYVVELLGSKIEVVKKKSLLETKGLELRINVIMKEWLDITGSERWSIGCHFIQWQINNTYMNNYRSAFSYVFGRKGKTKSKLIKTWQNDETSNE